MADTLRWGIISTARIGRKVIPAIQQAENCEVVAVASRSLDTGEAFASQLGIPKAFEGYEAMLESGEIDAVYNPLPNHLHAEWSIKAAHEGIHVLCEKPLAMNAAQAQEIVDTFDSLGVKLLEGFMYRYHPRNLRVKEMLAAGAVGEMQVIEATFTFPIGSEDDIRLKPEMGGGSLMDVGCYCISFMRLMTGEEPESAAGFAEIGKQSGVDELVAATMRFPSGVLGHFDCGFRTYKTNHAEIRGTTGRIAIDTSFIPDADQYTLIRHWHADGYDEIKIDPANQYTLMAADFASAILNNGETRYPTTDAVGNMQAIDMVKKATT